jgi:phosphoribosylformylglycinamidine synthase
VKAPEDLVYALGVTRRELGASEYWASKAAIGNSVPRVRVEENLDLYRRLHRAICAGLVRSAHDCSDGGFAVALAESAFAGDFGVEADLGALPTEGDLSLEYRLFAESAGRLIVTVRPGSAAAFEKAMAGAAFAKVGRVTESKRLRLTIDGRTVCDADVDELKAAWSGTLRF